MTTNEQIHVYVCIQFPFSGRWGWRCNCGARGTETFRQWTDANRDGFMHTQSPPPRTPTTRSA